MELKRQRTFEKEGDSMQKRNVIFRWNVLILTGFLGLFLTAFSPAWAADSTAAKAANDGARKTVADLTLAFVDMQAAILKTDEGAKAKERIEKEAQTKRDELISQQEELNKMGQEFQAQQSVLSEATRLDKQREIQMKLQNLRNSQMTFEQDVRRKEMQETQKIIENLQRIIDEVAKKKGYDLVFERGAGALLYASAIEDITADVVKEYNKRHKLKKEAKK